MNTTNNSFNKIIAFSIAMVTLLAAIIAFLQGDAAARDDRANRDSKQYAVQAFGREVSGNAGYNFDYHVYNLANRYGLQSIASSNRGDVQAALRYVKLAQEVTQFSPLLAPPYTKFSPDGMLNVDDARYEADTYLIETTALRENFLAASAVKEGWDYKANTYIKHITLLAVALFLFGLSTTLSQGPTKWIFSASGTAFTIVGVVWAAFTVFLPVFDLRTQGNAIQDYAQAVGLSYQGRSKEAITAFDKAVAAYPNYTNALVGRAEAYLALEDYLAAAKDYEAAIADGDSSAYVAGDLGWTYYLLGRFDDSVKLNRNALQKSPDELWIRFQLGLVLLVNGEADAAKEEYTQGMNLASQMVAEAKATAKEPPSYLWWGLEDGANALEYLLYHLDNPQAAPPINKILKPQVVKSTAKQMVYQLKSLALGLEYNGKPTATTNAKISALQFAEPILNDAGEVIRYKEPTNTFKYGINEIGVMFDYEKMKNGSDTLMKLYVNDEEDPSWRTIERWELGEKGNTVIPLNYAYSDTYTFDEGDYMVEIYVDYQLVQQGNFSITK